MPILNYNPIPSVEPQQSTGGNFQNIQAPATAFGSAPAQALEGLGQTFEKAGSRLEDVTIQRQQLFNQVAVDEASTKWRDAAEKLMYGDPNVPGDTGFNGLKGRAAMDAYPIKRKELQDLLDQQRGALQNPIQQHLFDRQNAQMRLYTMNEMGRHYDRANNLWTDSVQKGVQHSAAMEAGRAAALGDRGLFDEATQRGMNAVVKEAVNAGKSADEARSMADAFVAKRVEDWAVGLMGRDPLAAQKFIDSHKGDFKDPEKYLALSRSIKAEATKQEAEDIQLGRPSMVRGGAVEQLQGGSKRNLPLAPTVEGQLERAAAAVGDVKVEVFSGGQPSSGPNRVGSHRHDEGGAADIQLRDVKTGQLLDMRKPEDQARMSLFVAHAVAAGATGVGAAPDYMGPHGIHVGGGPAAVWGGDQTSKTAPEWLQQAYQVGATGRFVSPPQTPIAVKVSGEPDKLIVPDREPGELPDEQVPGLQKELDRIMSDPRSVKDGSLTPAGALAYKAARKKFNDAFADQQHARRIDAQAQQDQDQLVKKEYLGRMTSDSPNYPTTDEVKKDARISAAAQENLISLIRADSKPEPDTKISAANQTAIFKRMQPDYDGPDKITNEKQITDARVNGDLTRSGWEQSVKDFYDVYDPSSPRWQKQIGNTLKAIEAKIVPGVIGLGKQAYTFDETAAPRVQAWKQAVESKIAQYQQEGKNPLDLFLPAKPDYVGGQDFLAPFVGNLGSKLQDKKPLPPAANERAAVDISKMTTLSDLQAAAATNPLLRDAAKARALELGLVRAPTPEIAPPFAQ